MNKELTFRIMIGACCAAVLGFSACTAKINKDDNDAMIQMVARGASPIQARCAVKPNERDPSCVASLLNLGVQP